MLSLVVLVLGEGRLSMGKIARPIIIPKNKIIRVRFTALILAGIIAVNHPFEKQALGRRGFTRALAVARVENVAHGFWRSRRAPYLGERAHDAPHHRAQEAVTGNAKCEFVAALLPIAGVNSTDAIFPLVRRHAKRCEVVLTDEHVTRPFYRVEIELAACVPRIVPTDGLFGVTDAVKIMPASGIETRVKVGRCASGAFDRDIRGQHAIERVLQAVEGHIPRGREIDDLPECVNARIGAARCRDRNRRAVEPLEARLEFSLNRALAGLNLPALKVGAIVFEGQANLHDRACAKSQLPRDHTPNRLKNIPSNMGKVNDEKGNVLCR